MRGHGGNGEGGSFADDGVGLADPGGEGMYSSWMRTVQGLFYSDERYDDEDATFRLLVFVCVFLRWVT